MRVVARKGNFGTNIINGEKSVVQAVSPRVVDVEVIAQDSPLIKIPRIPSEVKVGSKEITFHRRQFPLRVCYAVAVNEGQGQILSKVGSRPSKSRLLPWSAIRRIKPNYVQYQRHVSSAP